ncbi:hypothetical protein PLICRDRAFT_181063 [Plicaturopsis crispa FD-325 SS-3]|uniref:Unplaced genomic scaffold PLICRscaffold_123, whole genome shotgun sequence n=1 Tax=Plicaturopsis crispa FD-325 SS-3 TaxID=944288 RepID=A0A0C9SV35_PLICR|nr:hypothetical protein PLICRDRAFT_181063 [Plicaturopsis crispa FD-325 SS-3]
MSHLRKAPTPFPCVRAPTPTPTPTLACPRSPACPRPERPRQLLACASTHARIRRAPAQSAHGNSSAPAESAHTNSVRVCAPAPTPAHLRGHSHVGTNVQSAHVSLPPACLRIYADVGRSVPTPRPPIAHLRQWPEMPHHTFACER